MHIIVCVDDRLGMMFNHRRQSRDSILREYILNMTEGHKLWMNHYSVMQFKDDKNNNIVVDDDFMQLASHDDYCFVEDLDLSSYEDQIDSITLCKWNRSYPGDLFFTINLSTWELVRSDELVGSSDDLIEIEVYSNVQKQAI